MSDGDRLTAREERDLVSEVRRGGCVDVAAESR
jgi:hypothetical protein